jgi:hypothetical protein
MKEVYMPAGEELNVGDPEILFVYLHKEIDMEGDLVDRYISLLNPIIYENVTMEQIYEMDGNLHYYIRANWTEHHVQTSHKMENIVDATDTADGSYDSVVRCDTCGKELSRTQIPITITSQQPTIEGSDKEWKVDTKSALTEIPEGAYNNYESVEDIKIDMNEYAVASNDQFNPEKVKTELLDVELKFKNEAGDWEVAHGENFPEDGVSILLPYPENTNKDDFIFVVTHLITSGEHAGSLEILNVSAEADGLHVIVTSLSPIAITYQNMNTTNGIAYDETDGKYYYYVDGVIDDTKNGLVPCEDGLFYYLEQGEWITTKFGLVEYGGGKFLVVNGVLDTSVSGLQLIGDNFYFLANGQLQSQYTGLALYDGQWFYVVEGVLAITFNGLRSHDGSLFLIASGQIQGAYTGLYNDAVTGNWYYIVLGQVQTSYTGLVFYDGAWFYLVGGILADDYTGTVEYDGVQFQVIGGQVVA